MTAIRLGTRGSALARTQSGLVAGLLEAAGTRVELVPILTEGDVRPPDTAWGEGAFVGALERALAEGRIDVAVHSAKDVPLDAAIPVWAFPLREDARDALVTRDGGATLSTLPPGTVIGTDSPRRTGFLLAARPDLRIVPLHGNVDTRLRRLAAGEVDVLVLAAAGLRRLGLSDRIDEIVDPALLPPAPGQGALAVQVRVGAPEVEARVTALDDRRVRAAVEAERGTLAAAGGGCRAPLGAFAEVDGGRIRLTAGVVRPDGAGRLVLSREGDLDDAPRIAAEMAAAFVSAGYRGDAPAAPAAVPARHQGDGS